MSKAKEYNVSKPFQSISEENPRNVHSACKNTKPELKWGQIKTFYTAINQGKSFSRVLTKHSAIQATSETKAGNDTVCSIMTNVGQTAQAEPL